MTEVEKQDFKEYLNSFTKREIIKAVADYHASLEFSGLKYLLERQRETTLFEKMQRASNEEDKARVEFFRYESILAQKYGDGNSVNLLMCLFEEKTKYLELYAVWKDKERQWIKASKEYDKFMGFEII